MATSNQNLTGLVNLNSIANLNGIATGTQALPMQQVVYYTGKWPSKKWTLPYNLSKAESLSTKTFVRLIDKRSIKCVQCALAGIMQFWYHHFSQAHQTSLIDWLIYMCICTFISWIRFITHHLHHQHHYYHLCTLIKLPTTHITNILDFFFDCSLISLFQTPPLVHSIGSPFFSHSCNQIS